MRLYPALDSASLEIVKDLILAMAIICSAFTTLHGEAIWIAGSGGVYRTELDDETGALSEPELMCAFESGSFLAVHPVLDVVYSSYNKRGEAGYVSLVRKEGSKQLQIQSRQSPADDVRAPTHLAVSSNGDFLAGAHYGGQSDFVFELEEDGSISDRFVKLEHTGSGPLRGQDQARPHWVGFDSTGSMLHSVDLGSDRIWSFGMGPTVADIKQERITSFPMGTGPRHMSMAPNGKFAYVSGEISLDVTTLSYDPISGRFDPKQYMPAVAERGEGLSLSEIQVHKGGEFVYVGVRGPDLIVSYRVDRDDGTLSLVERQEAMVEWPRNFTISHSGKWLIAAGQRSNDLVVFWLNPFSGELEPTESRISVENPVCVRAWGRM